jgi:lysophospholipid acyltransferase (LPLAT)-like uncharacterized protein
MRRLDRHQALRLLAPVAATLLRGLAATWRVRSEGPDPLAAPKPTGLAALWHRNVLVAAGAYRDTGIVVPVSRSQDGDLIVAVIRHLGLGTPPRGSSKRGAVPLLRSLVRLVRERAAVAILTDGPVGPARVSKPGVIQVARLSGEAIIPVAISARPCLRFGSWDRMLLPLPFARVVCRYGPSLLVERGAKGERIEALRRELDARLGAMTDALDAQLDASG